MIPLFYHGWTALAEHSLFQTLAMCLLIFRESVSSCLKEGQKFIKTKNSAKLCNASCAEQVWEDDLFFIDRNFLPWRENITSSLPSLKPPSVFVNFTTLKLYFLPNTLMLESHNGNCKRELKATVYLFFFGIDLNIIHVIAGTQTQQGFSSQKIEVKYS